MNRKPAFVAAVVLGVVLSGGAWIFVRAFSAYSAAMASTPPALKCVSDSDRLRTLIAESTAGAWRTIGEGENGFDELFAGLDLTPGIDGCAELYAFTPVRFSLFDSRTNSRNAAIALVRAGLVPRADDGTFHLSSDKSFGVVFVSESIVSFHRYADGRYIDGSMVGVSQGGEQGGRQNGE